jgi:cytochrome c peroxidase
MKKLFLATLFFYMFVFNVSTYAANSDFPYAVNSPNEAKVELGRLLMFDKILSGNKNISCATCHHSLTDTGSIDLRNDVPPSVPSGLVAIRVKKTTA